MFLVDGMNAHQCVVVVVVAKVAREIILVARHPSPHHSVEAEPAVAELLWERDPDYMYLGLYVKPLYCRRARCLRSHASTRLSWVQTKSETIQSDFREDVRYSAAHREGRYAFLAGPGCVDSWSRKPWLKSAM